MGGGYFCDSGYRFHFSHFLKVFLLHWSFLSFGSLTATAKVTATYLLMKINIPFQSSSYVLSEAPWLEYVTFFIKVLRRHCTTKLLVKFSVYI